MRQDISTYEAVCENKLGVGKQCDKLVQTIDTRNRRLRDLNKRDAPQLENFLDSILEDLCGAYAQKADRVVRFTKPMVFATQDEKENSLMPRQLDSDGDMPTNLWKQKNRIDERRATFLKYFIMSDDVDIDDF